MATTVTNILLLSVIQIESVFKLLDGLWVIIVVKAMYKSCYNYKNNLFFTDKEWGANVLKYLHLLNNKKASYDWQKKKAIYTEIRHLIKIQHE